MVESDAHASTIPVSSRPAAWAELPRRERRKLEVRARILESAAHLFEQQGVRATTVSEIAERADVAQKTLFNHFPSKQHLVRALAHLGIDQLLSEIETARKEALDTRGRLVHFFGQLATNAADVGPMHRELLAEIICAVQESPEQAIAAKRLGGAFAALVRDGLAAGEIRAGFGEEVLTDLVLGTFYALMFNWVSLDEFPLGERARESALLLGCALCGDPDDAADRGRGRRK